MVKDIRKLQIILLIATMGCGSLWGEEPFAGILTYSVHYEKTTTPMRYYSDGQQVRIEAGKEGDPHLIWLGGLEGIDGVAFLSPFNKTYSIESAGALGWQGPVDTWNGKKKKPREKRVQVSEPVSVDYMGLDCRKYTLKTGGPDLEVWILKSAPAFPLSVLRLWDPLSETAPAVYRLCREQTGIPVQIQSKNWRGKSIFSMTLESVEASVPEPGLFSIPGNYSQTRSAYAPGGEDADGKKRGPPPGREGGPPPGNRP